MVFMEGLRRWHEQRSEGSSHAEDKCEVFCAEGPGVSEFPEVSGAKQSEDQEVL